MTNTTTLQNIEEMYSELVDAYGEDVANALCDGDEVAVGSECTDGFWNITLEDGTEVVGISWYHLEGFTADSEE